jgi:hypothetical protein
LQLNKVPLFELMSYVIQADAQRVLVLLSSNPPMMPALLSSNSMAMIGKDESLRFAKIGMLVVAVVASAVASAAVAADSEVALVAVVVALVVAGGLADEVDSEDQAAMVEEVALAVAPVVIMAAVSTLLLPLHPALLILSLTTLPLVVTRAP